ncbi:MAG: hypothetical protein WC802_00740 [Patescibacteria group bacterium]|jgi:hypothetical protein
MGDTLESGMYPELMTDAHHVCVDTVKAMDLTGDMDAKFTFLVYYGVDEAGDIFVQLAEERGSVPRKSRILPLSDYARDPLPDDISKFITPSPWLKPRLVAELVRANAT